MGNPLARSEVPHREAAPTAPSSIPTSRHYIETHPLQTESAGRFWVYPSRRSLALGKLGSCLFPVVAVLRFVAILHAASGGKARFSLCVPSSTSCTYRQASNLGSLELTFRFAGQLVSLGLGITPPRIKEATGSSRLGCLDYGISPLSETDRTLSQQPTF